MISSDLSHYLGYEEAQRIDQETALFIEGFREMEISSERACGAYSIRGFLSAAHRHGCTVRTILKNSGDTAGTKDRVVGYGAFTFT